MSTFLRQIVTTWELRGETHSPLISHGLFEWDCRSELQWKYLKKLIVISRLTRRLSRKVRFLVSFFFFFNFLCSARNLLSWNSMNRFCFINPVWKCYHSSWFYVLLAIKGIEKANFTDASVVPNLKNQFAAYFQVFCFGGFQTTEFSRCSD